MLGHCLREVSLIILQRYILREWLWTFLAATVVLLIVLIGLSLGEMLGDIADGQMPSGLLSILIVLKMPEVLGTILPLSVFIAVIWGLGRFYRDQEMAVMRASGFHWRLLLRPLLSLIVPVAGVLLFTGLYLAPLCSSLAQQKLEEAFRNAAEWGLQTGRFHVLRGGDLVLYVAAVEKDGRTLRHVFMQQREAEREQVWAAERGYYSLDFRIMEFARNDLRLPDFEQRGDSDSIEARSTGALLFSGDPEEVAELQWRLSPAIAAIVLGLLAIPLSHSAPREGRGGRALLGILVYTVYANVLYMCRNWLIKGDLPAFPGMWWVHALVLIAALVWLHRQGRMVGKG